MALTDVNFQEGEGQDFILELPSVAYGGTANDILVETNGSQFLLLEAPEITGGGGNIFIMSE
ncbi:MAG TPA: hypothetical protein PK295_04910 [Candidatus Magasanikbacteria bacterium]|nr:hypothetical protein [Candidatus Magasanikbacteria bacterium]